MTIETDLQKLRRNLKPLFLAGLLSLALASAAFGQETHQGAVSDVLDQLEQFIVDLRREKLLRDLDEVTRKLRELETLIQDPEPVSPE